MNELPASSQQQPRELPILCLVRHTESPMGQQSYETEIIGALHSLLAGSDLGVQRGSYGTFRSAARYRLPHRIVDRLPLRMVSSLAYWQRSYRLVHRMDLRIPPTSLGRELVTIHDLPPCRFPDEGQLPSWSLASGKADSCVIVPSCFAAEEVHDLIQPDRVEVIPYGVSSIFDRWKTPGRLGSELLGLRPRTYILHAAGATRRKNLAGLADAWARVTRHERDLYLVLCGPPDPRRTELFAHLDRVIMPGRLSQTDVADLMTTALAVVVPSIYEGFGLPALEGMAVGVPVIAARRGALPEVCAKAGLLVEPDGGSIASAILDLAGDPAEWSRLADAGRERAAAFSWQAAAEAHAKLYREMLLAG